MTGTCRAAVFRGDETYEIREFPIPDPPPGGAVLQVEAVGLCGSDVAQFAGIELVPGACAFPVVPGHETVGRVAKLAPDATLGVAEGDRVAVNEIMPQLHGGAGFTPQSMAAAVQRIESGAVRTDVVAGEVFDLDGIDEAMALLARRDPARDAVRVGLRHSHGAAS